MPQVYAHMRPARLTQAFAFREGRALNPLRKTRSSAHAWFGSQQVVRIAGHSTLLSVARLSIIAMQRPCE